MAASSACPGPAPRQRGDSRAWYWLGRGCFLEKGLPARLVAVINRGMKLTLCRQCALFSCALLGAAVLSSCAATNTQDAAGPQAAQTDHRELYRHIAVESTSGELQRALSSDLAALGYDVVGAQAPTAAQAALAPGAIAVVYVRSSQPAWVTLGAEPAYVATDKDAMRAHKAEVEIVIKNTDGQPLASYRGTSRPDESWSSRESERSALRAAMRTFPKRENLNW